MNMTVQNATLRDALTDAKAWHQDMRKSCSKQPPSTMRDFAMATHAEQIENIDAALAVTPHTAGCEYCVDGLQADGETPCPCCVNSAPAPAKEWRCFHCDEVFTTQNDARLHFGMDQCSDPACKIKLGAEKSLLVALRRAETELQDAWAAIHNETTEAAKAYYAQQSRHGEQLRAAEELGFERGIKDSTAHIAALEEQALRDRKLRDEAQHDALLWQYSVAAGDHPPLLVTVWNQRRDALARAAAAERAKENLCECTTSPTDYYKRAAALLEKLRDEIGSGFGEGDIEHISDIVIARLRAWDKLDREDVKRRLSTTPTPTPTPDYCYDPKNWEFTCNWEDREQVHGHGEALSGGKLMEVATLIRGPRKWVADVPITWDDDGDPDNTEIQWFDSEDDARAALSKKGGEHHA